MAARKRLVVCVDGTWCTPDGTNRKPASHGPLTNVFNVYASVKNGLVTDRHGSTWDQQKSYHPGLGALEKTSTIARLNAGAWGEGWQDLIRDIYERCCALGEDDEVWLFGFSRGAYIVRAVAGLLHYIRKLKSVGTSTFQKDFKRAINVYASIRGKGELGAGQINLHLQTDTVRAPRVRFVGAFDTVKAVEDQDLYDISLNTSIEHLRHALALHEDRNRFTPEYLWPDDSILEQISRSGRTFVQAWFAGAHVDIGGSAKEAGLSLYPLQWMLIECQNLGLALKFHGNVPNAPPIDDPMLLVFPPDELHGKGVGAWSCMAGNKLEIQMQDLRSVHTLARYGARYKVKINRDKHLFWIRRDRVPFQKIPHTSSQDGPRQILRGYCTRHPVGTIIHPSVYCLIDSDINLIMDGKHGELFQHISEWTGRMLGEIDLILEGDTRKIPNPGFWHNTLSNAGLDDLPPLRILVCGNSGVGKSTLISRVFGVDFNAVSHRMRGEHNVRNGVQIPGRNDFILHDSRGFEAGSEEEFDVVEAFINERIDQEDLAKQLHVIWLCVKTMESRVVQKATERLFKAMHRCQRHVPVVLVATQKDQFLDMYMGKMRRTGVSLSDAEAEAQANDQLDEQALQIEADVVAIKGARVDAVVCVEQDDQKSIEKLTETSFSVFQDEATRLMYIKAQMALPDLKIHMALHEVMRRYKHAVRTAAATSFLPFGLTGSRQGYKDDLCKRILTCFGVSGLDSRKALSILQSNLRDGLAEGLSMFWAETLAAGGVVALVFFPLAPLTTVTASAGAYIITPATARLFLCTACDLILILARSFQIAAAKGRAQPQVQDVEIAATAFNKDAARVHQQINDLVPMKNPFKCFAYGKIQARFAAIVDEVWRQMVKDSVHEAAAVAAAGAEQTVPRGYSLELPQSSGGVTRTSSRHSTLSWRSWRSSTATRSSMTSADAGRVLSKELG